MDILANSPALTPNMYAILLEWLCELCESYYLHDSVLHLSKHILDQYLLQCSASRSTVQLVGMSALLIANKLVMGEQGERRLSAKPNVM